MNSNVIFKDSYISFKIKFIKKISISINDIKKIEIVEDKKISKMSFLILYIFLFLIVAYFSIYLPTYVFVLSVLLVYFLMFHFLNIKNKYLIISTKEVNSIKVKLKLKDVEKALELIDFVGYLDKERTTKKLIA